MWSYTHVTCPHTFISSSSSSLSTHLLPSRTMLHLRYTQGGSEVQLTQKCSLPPHLLHFSFPIILFSISIPIRSSPTPSLLLSILFGHLIWATRPQTRFSLVWSVQPGGCRVFLRARPGFGLPYLARRPHQTRPRARWKPGPVCPMYSPNLYHRMC